MDEEIGVKVTRLRRRLSVEAEDVKSPSTQSTPTKKRGGRLAAKPQLELIDENATGTEKPKRTRKSTVRDAEPEEKAVTPSRRSTRIRSNTSIVSETPLEPEDKGTPSRRVTRIKSNTSIVAETTQRVDSPRAKRAARRTSQVGSDNEAPITPGRTTRRTRKDSTSSVDKQADPNLDKLGPQVKEVIIEESENNIKDSTSKDTPTKDNNESPTTRRSPRLIEKTSKRSSLDLDNIHELGSAKESNGVKSDPTDASVVSSLSTPKINSHKEINLSISSSNLVKQLHDEPKTGTAYLNKTTSALEESQAKSKRRRTKSWTTIGLNSSNNEKFLSDNEATRKKNKTKDDTPSECGSGENVLNTSNISIKKTEEHFDIKDNSLNSSTKSEKKKKKRNEMKSNDNSILTDETKVPTVNDLAELNKSVTNDKEVLPQTRDSNFTEKFLFHTSPRGPVESLVYIEDSDSNTGTSDKGNIQQEIENEDQCVPVVEHQLGDETHAKNNCSYEPMDIDETMPENVSLTAFTDKNSSEIKSPDLLKRKSLENSALVNIDTNSKSHRKSNISDLDGKNTPRKSNKKVLTADSSCNDLTDILNNESKRKSINDTDEVEDNSNNPDCNNTLHTSKIKSSISSVTISDDKDNKSLNSSSCTGNENKSSIDKKKPNRKSSLTFVAGEDDSETKTNEAPSDLNEIHKENDDTMRSKSLPNADLNGSITNLDVNESITNERFNKTKKRSIVAETEHDISTRKSSLDSVINNDKIDSEFNKSNNENDNSNLGSSKSKRKSSNTNDNNLGNNFNKSKNKSIVSDVINSSIEKSKNKSKRKSSISKTDVEDSNDSVLNKSCNKSKRKSSISDMESHVFDKSNNENKSTLVLSQIKDVSETNLIKELELNESKDCNEQLSKSVNVPDVIKDKETNKKNLSLTYSTSTPLQQKPLKKIGMQINSSMITPTTTEIKNNSSLRSSKKNTSSLSLNDASESSDGESEESSENENDSDEESVNKSKLIEGEADVASEDYESGDSRDEDAKDYEEQHEIIEKGETLDSEEEDFSDDSEYEKDSFVVDSDEEDNELLSGSGDDLSMSADELSMSAKSKKKYNERKMKEQKKASREMYEARHKLNNSDKSNSYKKVNRQRLESSESECEVEVAKPKKNKRARIDSSQDITTTQSDHDTSEFKKKKKPLRRLSDSVCEENATNEKEISVHENHETDKEDPLSLHGIVKEEPKTPKKDLNISAVSTINVEIEAVDVENNISILKSNQTKDPLQTTSANDSEDISEESISENEEITQNYNSVLNDLKVKSLDMSCNLDKKVKRKDKAPIIDQLNLTQTKNLKSRKQNSDPKRAEKQKKNTEKVNKSINTEEDGSSDSIDMKLLFNEDSTDSEVKVSSEKNISVEQFIPLKRTVGKTNILEKSVSDTTSETATGLNNSSVLNVSKSKKVEHTSLPEATEDKENGESLTFFFDTTGTHIGMNKSVDTSIQSSAKKKRKNTISKNVKSDDDSNDAPLEISYQGDKNKSKKKLSNSQTEELEIVTADINTPVSVKKNKKNKKSINNSQIIEQTDDVSNDAPLEVSYQSDKNKSKQNLSNSQTEEQETVTADVKTPVSAKKIKKNKKGMNKSQVAEQIDDSNIALLEVSNQKDKNKDKSTQNLDNSHTGEQEIVGTDVKTPVSAKKNKKNKKSLDTSQITENKEIDSQGIFSQNIPIENKNTQKQHIVTEQSVAVKETNVNETKDVNEKDISKKRKRSTNESIEETEIVNAKTLEGPQLVNESLKPVNQKKKRKISHTTSNENVENKVPDAVFEKQEQGISVGKSKKKIKTAALQNPVQNIDDSTKRSKKRKERDDDVNENLSKIVKQNSLDKVHVPRLPINVVKQLDEKPKKNETMANITSTTTFKVEQTKKRRNKPSNYLEQSVYLNDSTEEQTKNKTVKPPKVLPFIPTASISDYGFTTNFKVNVIPQETQFVAQSSDVYNFKQDYLEKKRIKKLGTFEKYKRHRTIKLSKF